MKYILVKADPVKVRADGYVYLSVPDSAIWQLWRHSSHGNYYIHDLESKRTWPLVSPTNPPIASYATWSPTGQLISYVLNNDLYILPSAS